MSTTFLAEAGEWITGWQLFKNMNVRDRVDINISRFCGSGDEFMNLYVVVEGKMIEKADLLASQMGNLLGQKQAFEDRLNSADTLEKLTQLQEEIEQ